MRGPRDGPSRRADAMLVPLAFGVIPFALGLLLAFFGRGLLTWAAAAGIIALGAALLFSPSLIGLEIIGGVTAAFGILALFDEIMARILSPGLFIVGIGSLTASGAILAGYL
jgi:hypothetical protein